MRNNLYPCWVCGGMNLVEVKCKPRLRVFCPECFDAYEQSKQDNLDSYLDLKMEVMWERALRNLEKQEVSLCDYYDEAITVKELALDTHSKFQSSHEMMTAMELLRKRVKAKMQYNVLRYRVDFLLPELKVALEIDGKLHDFKTKKDSKRDIEILNELNKEDRSWEIIRIPTKYIEQNIKQLIPAIIALKKEKQKLRKMNNGFIPATFSRRDAHQQKIVAENLKDEALHNIECLIEETAPLDL